MIDDDKERWYCINCHQTGPLTRTGRCGTCASEAVTCERPKLIKKKASSLVFPSTELGQLAKKVLAVDVERYRLKAHRASAMANERWKKR